MTVATKNRIREISRFAQALTDSEQEILLKSLKQKALVEKAIELDSSVKKNTLTIEEIVREVRITRKKRNGR